MKILFVNLALLVMVTGGSTKAQPGSPEPVLTLGLLNGRMWNDCDTTAKTMHVLGLREGVSLENRSALPKYTASGQGLATGDTMHLIDKFSRSRGRSGFRSSKPCAWLLSSKAEWPSMSSNID